MFPNQLFGHRICACQADWIVVLTNTGSYANLTFTSDGEGLGLKRSRRGVHPVEAVRVGEFDAMMSALDGMRRMEVRARLILGLMYYAGLRRDVVRAAS